MRKLFKTFLFIVVILGILLVFSSAMSETWTVKRKVEIKADPADVFPLLAKPAAWPSWTVWNTVNMPNLRFRYDGPSEGRGARSAWTNGKKGGGKMHIDQCLPPNLGKAGLLRYTLNMDQMGKSQGRFTIAKPISHTEVVWELSGKHEGNFLNKAVSKWMMLVFKHMIGNDMDESLAGLKEKVKG